MANILLVDDEPDVVEILSTRLRAAGHAILPAGDGTEALDVLRREPVDLMVLDLMMPGMDGLALLGRIRRSGSPRPPTLVLTAHGYSGIPEAVLQAGADDWLTKPFSGQALENKVCRLLGRTPDSWDRKPVLLVLDPDEDFRKQARARLTLMGYAVEQAGTWTQAVRRVHVAKPDVILFSVDLPELTGLDAREINPERWTSKQTSVIAMVPRDDPAAEERARRLGADAVATKPVAWGDLGERVKRVLSGTAGK